MKTRFPSEIFNFSIIKLKNYLNYLKELSEKKGINEPKLKTSMNREKEIKVTNIQKKFLFSLSKIDKYFLINCISR